MEDELLEALRKLATKWSAKNPDVSIEVAAGKDCFEVTVRTTEEPWCSHTAPLRVDDAKRAVYAEECVLAVYDSLKDIVLASALAMPDDYASELVATIKALMLEFGLFKGCELTFKLSPCFKFIVVQAYWSGPDTYRIPHKDSVRIPVGIAGDILGDIKQLAGIVELIATQAIACRERNHPCN